MATKRNKDEESTMQLRSSVWKDFLDKEAELTMMYNKQKENTQQAQISKANFDAETWQNYINEIRCLEHKIIRIKEQVSDTFIFVVQTQEYRTNPFLN